MPKSEGRPEGRPTLILTGYGDVPLIRLPLRGGACGATGCRVPVTGRSYALGVTLAT
jgi:hypothetical protein